jgi:hypothetical protein
MYKELEQELLDMDLKIAEEDFTTDYLRSIEETSSVEDMAIRIEHVDIVR